MNVWACGRMYADNVEKITRLSELAVDIYSPVLHVLPYLVVIQMDKEQGRNTESVSAGVSCLFLQNIHANFIAPIFTLYSYILLIPPIHLQMIN
jgi:hypothetical protein